MKVLHVPYSYPPDAPGGTELYVAGLCDDLVALGIDAAVAAPAASSGSYVHQGVPVRRFSVGAALELEALYGAGDSQAAASFAAVLDDERPDVVHMHALTAACSIRLLREAKRRGLPVAFTYHTPTVSCPRGTLMLWGREACDGRLEVARCTACAAASHGVARPLASLLGRVPPALGDGLGQLGVSGGAMTAARLSSLIRSSQQALREFFDEVDAVVSLAGWVRRVLLENGVVAGKIVDSRHGVRRTDAGGAGPRRKGPAVVRLAHLGRVHPVKGTDLLIRAFRRTTAPALRLDVYGILQDASAEALAGRLREAAAGDPRIRLLSPVPADRVIDTLRTYDAVVVPSQWLETGPLVVLEAFAAGVPVIGSRLGGIADKIADGEDGLLVDAPHMESSWVAALHRCASDPQFLAGLRWGVRPPRDRREVARDMAALYASLTGAALPPGARPSPTGVTG